MLWHLNIIYVANRQPLAIVMIGVLLRQRGVFESVVIVAHLLQKQPLKVIVLDQRRLFWTTNAIRNLPDIFFSFVQKNQKIIWNAMNFCSSLRIGDSTSCEMWFLWKFQVNRNIWLFHVANDWEFLVNWLLSTMVNQSIN